VPRAIYIGIMLLIAARVLLFYTRYFNLVRDAGGF
jgi:hypothetical protein